MPTKGFQSVNTPRADPRTRRNWQKDDLNITALLSAAKAEVQQYVDKAVRESKQRSWMKF